MSFNAKRSFFCPLEGIDALVEGAIFFLRGDMRTLPLLLTKRRGESLKKKRWKKENARG
jgi:hypothetical protein